MMLDREQCRRLDRELDRWALERLQDRIRQLQSGHEAVLCGTGESLLLSEIRQRLDFAVEDRDVLGVAAAITARYGRIVQLKDQDSSLYLHFGKAFVRDKALYLPLAERKLIAKN